MSTGTVIPKNRFLLCLLALLALPIATAGCGDDDDDDDDDDDSGEDAGIDVDAGVDASASCPDPVLPEGPGSLRIVYAGAPLEMFGGEDDPDYATAFADLATDGADLFAPIFVTEDAENGRVMSGHFDDFLAEGCADESNPYEAAGDDIKIVFPGFALVEEDEWTVPLVPEDVSARLQGVIDTCMGGDDSVLGGVQLYDRPAYTATNLFEDDEPANDFLAANIPVASAAFRTVTDAPMIITEAALPFYFDRYPEYADLLPEDRNEMQGNFWTTVDQMGGAVDIFGFEVDPIDKPVPPVIPGDPSTLPLDEVGKYTDQARSLEPDAVALAVLQGFGDDDLGTRPGRRPTELEIRYMAMDAIIHGARAIWWYGQSAIEADSPLWEAIRATTRELRSIGPILDLPNRDLPPQISRVEARGFADGDTVYMIAANPGNPTDPPQRLSVPLFAAEGTHLTLWDLTTGDVLASESFDPYVEMLDGFEVRVLAITTCTD